MKKPTPYVVAVVAVLAAACSSTVAGPAPAPADAAAPQDATLDAAVDVPGDAPGPCRLPSGATCPRGMVCPAGDGCNTCMCPADGGLAGCTLIGCTAPDAGPGRCRRAEDCGAGRFCQFAESGCAAEGVCAQPTPCSESQTYCGCDGATYTGCVPDRPTARRGECGAADGGARTCRTSADCAAGFEQCNFSAPGCGVTGTCGAVTDCAFIAEYCGCDGETFRDCPGGRASRPYRAVGACAGPGDAGAADGGAGCDGAHIGRGGRYCAGPADEPLPIDCCAWNCDTSTVGCDSIPPRCPDGEVNTVVGTCWGPCVPARACMPHG